MKFIHKIADTLCKIFLAAQVVIVSWVVFGRFVLNKTPAWGEELALLCMVWFSLLSISIGVFNKAHITMPLIELLIPKNARKYLNVINHLLALFLAVCMIGGGVMVTILNSKNVMPGMGIPSTWLYLAIPVAGVFLLLSLLGRTKEILHV